MQPRTLESKLERSVCLYAKQRGCLGYKFTSPGNAGVPDRIFFYHGRVLLIEFKQLTGNLSAQQRHQIKQLQEQGIRVEVIAEENIGRDLIDSFIAGYTNVIA